MFPCTDTQIAAAGSRHRIQHSEFSDDMMETVARVSAPEVGAELFDG